ncbi:MAG: PadR family transcriptional regulator [Erysipelotrichaceae bacterium]
MIPSQMLKGILEGCILSIIAQEETYGYEISEKLKAIGFGEISEGTIYPMLLRLTKNEYIEAKVKSSNSGPSRKYYSLTKLGKSELELFESSFLELVKAVNNLIGGKHHE